MRRAKPSFGATKGAVGKNGRNQIADQIIGITAQKTAAARQVELIEQDLEDQMILFERGLTQATRIRDLKREQARLQGILGELIARKAQAEGLITEIEIETVKISSTRHETAISQLRDQHYHEMELKGATPGPEATTCPTRQKSPGFRDCLWPAGSLPCAR